MYEWGMDYVQEHGRTSSEDHPQCTSVTFKNYSLSEFESVEEPSSSVPSPF